MSLWMPIEYRRVADCLCANFIENCYMPGSECSIIGHKHVIGMMQ